MLPSTGHAWTARPGSRPGSVSPTRAKAVSDSTTAVEDVQVLGGEVGPDYRFAKTPVPVVAKVPSFPEMGFGADEEAAARNLIEKIEAT